MVMGIWFLIHSRLKLQKNQKQIIGFQIAWRFTLVKVFTLLSISFLLSFSLNFYTSSFDIESNNIELLNQITDLELELHEVKNEYSQANTSFYQQIVDIQNEKIDLQNQIHTLNNEITNLYQQGGNLQKELQLVIVEVYGNCIYDSGSYKSITYSANGIDHTVEVSNNEYSIKLENYQTYMVTGQKRNWFLFIELGTSTVDIGVFHLDIETQRVVKNW